MRFTIALASVAAFIGGVVAQTINTPSNLVQCQPSLISWTGTTGSVQLPSSITAGDNPSGPAIHDLGQQTGTSFTYRVEEPGGTSLVFNIRTSTGAIFQTGIVTVTTGGNADCLTSASSSSASGSSTEEGSSTGVTTTTAGTTRTTTSAATSAPATTTATSPTTRVTTTGRTTTTGTSASGSSAGASTTSSDNSAPTQYVGAGVAGAVGLAVMALLA